MPADVLVDGFTGIAASAMTPEQDRAMLERGLAGMRTWHETFGARARYVLWDVFGRQVQDRLAGRHIADGSYRHPAFNYDEIAAALPGLDIVDLAPLLRLPIHEVSRLFIDSSNHPSQLGYLLLNGLIFDRLDAREAYARAVGAVEGALLALAQDVSESAGQRVLLTGRSVWLDTLSRYMGANGAQRLADAGLILAPLDHVPGQPSLAQIVERTDLARCAAVVVSAGGRDISALLARAFGTGLSMWTNVPVIDWESATEKAIRDRRETPRFARLDTALRADPDAIKPALVSSAVEQGPLGTPSWSGITALLRQSAGSRWHAPMTGDREAVMTAAPSDLVGAEAVHGSRARACYDADLLTESRRSRAAIEHFHLLRSHGHPANPSTSSSPAYLYGLSEGVSADLSSSLPLELRFGNRYEGNTPVTLSVLGDVGIIVSRGQAQAVIQLSRRGRFVFLTEAATRQIFSAGPRDYDSADSFTATRTSATDWEMFELEDAPAPDGVTKLCFDLLAAGAHGIVDALLGGGTLPGLLRCAVNAVTSAPELASAIRATGDTELVFRAIRAWARDELPYTIALLENLLSPGEAPLTIGRNMDWLSSSEGTPADRIVNDAIRLCLAKEVRSCVVATARNEGVYMLEWIAYQRLLGFERIVIYTNNNTDGSLALLQELHRTGVITLIESEVSPGADAQMKAYRHAARLLPNAISAEWCAFLDIDEFVVLNGDRFGKLDDYLNWAARKGGDAIALTWSLVETTTAVQDWINLPVLQRLTRSSPRQVPLIKCFSRPELIDASEPHHPVASNGLAMRMSNGDGMRHLWEILPDMPIDPTRAVRAAKDACHLYHFELRTLAEMIWKYSRNRGNHALQGEDLQMNADFPGRLHHFKSCFANAGSSTLPFVSVTSNLHKEMDYLRTLGTVSSAEEQMKIATAARLQELLSRLPDYLASDQARAIDSESRALLEAVVAAYGADAPPDDSQS
ncbi:glycosyltransferase family 2 protein [Arthrobacter sp. MW3 TE3886]|uniref:glycosyltransferase family 2 protein n=1 Tax=Arthrobacter sp. MW3 TE3886 TaxID=3156254 RepID=UPI0035167B18